MRQKSAIIVGNSLKLLWERMAMKFSLNWNPNGYKSHIARLESAFLHSLVELGHPLEISPKKSKIKPNFQVLFCNNRLVRNHAPGHVWPVLLPGGTWTRFRLKIWHPKIYKVMLWISTAMLWALRPCLRLLFNFLKSVNCMPWALLCWGRAFLWDYYFVRISLRNISVSIFFALKPVTLHNQHKILV